jgi:predicted RNA-binding Zn-ribbon protein involved in translation (DUF1610 family)
MMEISQEFVMVNCTTCGNPIRTKQDTVSVFCLKCKNWMQINPQRLGEKKDNR